jgi:tetratricopeptide (TPR) repeat protein
VFLCFTLACATSPTPPPSTIPEECLTRPKQLLGPKLSDEQYRGAIAVSDTASIAGHLAALLAERPDDAASQRAFAATLADMGDAAGSAVHFRCSLALDPMPDTRIELAAQLIHTAAYADAKSELLRAREGAQPDFRARTLMAVALEGMGKLREAAEELAHAAEETKTSAVLFRRAADLYARAGDMTLAGELTAKADALDPPPPPRDLRPLVEAKPPPKKKKKRK